MKYHEQLQEISNRMNGEKETYWIIHHAKHNRTIAFKNNKLALKFIKERYKHKRLLYYLLRLNKIGFGIEKIQLSKNLGDVILIANQIKCIDLKKERVFTFYNKEKFGEAVANGVILSFKGFAPRIYHLDKERLFIEEELLYDKKLSKEEIINRIEEFHKSMQYKYVHGDLVLDHVKVDKYGTIKFIDWDNFGLGDTKIDWRSFVK